MKFGFENLNDQKVLYDGSLREKRYDDIRYVLFTAKARPTIVFSGLFYPDFDFMGRRLQDLAGRSNKLSLITFCSAPMNSGWGFLFSWHSASSSVCCDFMRSLAAMIHEKRKLEDMLLRLVISNCENHAFSPLWWEGLPSEHKEQIISRASEMADPLAITPSSYLTVGLEGIAEWEFHHVISKM